MIPFNIPSVVGTEEKYINEAIKNRKISGDGYFTKKCHAWFESTLQCNKSLLTTSCTHALEMSAILADIKEGDEIIMPSFTFTSTANAFVLRGARIVFIDIRPDTMNIDEKLIEAAITPRTRAIVPVHYAGISSEMNVIMEIARAHNLIVIEDAAQAILSKYNNQYPGTIGNFGCLSFHETKNIQCGEGGVLLINDKKLVERAEILREKGTDRSKFFRGEIDKYGWVDIGSSYLPSELNAAFLYAQLESVRDIISDRIKSWNLYNKHLEKLCRDAYIDLPIVPNGCEHNGHIFYIKVKDKGEREKLIKYMKEREIFPVFHYIPLHTSKAGKMFGSFFGRDTYTTKESERLLRLPLYYNLNENDIEYIANTIHKFYKSS